MEKFGYTKEDLEQRMAEVQKNGTHIKKCLEFAIDKIGEYKKAINGLIVDDAVFEVYTKLNSALEAYENLNNRVTKKIGAKLEEMQPVEKERSSSVPRRSV